MMTFDDVFWWAELSDVTARVLLWCHENACHVANSKSQIPRFQPYNRRNNHNQTSGSSHIESTAPNSPIHTTNRDVDAEKFVKTCKIARHSHKEKTRAGDSLDSGQKMLKCRFFLFYRHCDGQFATVTFGVNVIIIVDATGG